MAVQPGLQATLKMRKELASVSATCTLVPSGIPVTVSQSPALMVTVCGAPVPTVTVKVNGVPAVILVPATLQIFSFPTVEVVVKLTSLVVPGETGGVTAGAVGARVARAAPRRPR